MKNDAITVSEFTSLVNQTLDFAYPEVIVEGEVSSFKVSQQKWVFFDLKDESCLVGCFIPIFQLKTALEDGMLIRVKATPQLTKWGKFSLTVREIELAGEGSVKRAFELLRQKFEKEGLFLEERKRKLPEFPQRVLLVTSKQAAAYNDFVTVVNDRFAGLQIDHYQVAVQGETAPAQLVEAIEYSNRHKSDYDVLVIIRGGGSLEDLQAFNNEEVVRAVYGSKVPTLVGIGHEDDISLAELASDVRAATPTDAARRLVPDMTDVLARIDHAKYSIQANLNALISVHRKAFNSFYHSFEVRLGALKHNLDNSKLSLKNNMDKVIKFHSDSLKVQLKLLQSLDPEAILSRGYSIARVGTTIIRSSHDIKPKDTVVLQLHQGEAVLVMKESKRKSNETGQTEIKF